MQRPGINSIRGTMKCAKDVSPKYDGFEGGRGCKCSILYYDMTIITKDIQYTLVFCAFAM